MPTEQSTARQFLYALMVVLLWAAATGPGLAQDEGVTGQCTVCHGLNGEGTEASYPVLAGQPAQYLLDQLKAYRSGVRAHPQMQATAEALSPAEMREAARIYAEADAPPLLRPADAPQAALAEELIGKGAWDRGIAPCSLCHVLPESAGGIRLSGHETPRIHGQPEGYLASTLTAYAEGERQTGGMKIMQSYASRLTRAEIASLAAYLATYAAETADE